MSKRAREIIAVVILVVLIFGLMSIAGWYFNQSRHWNVAATSVDDSIGSMDGYTIVAYRGILAKPKGVSDENPLPENWDAFLDDQNRGDTSKQPLWMRLFAPNDEEPPTFAEVLNSYEEKGASVLVLDVEDVTMYRIPIVEKVGEKTVGIVSVLAGDTLQRTTHHTHRLEEAAPDYMVAIVESLKSIERVSDSYDVIICTTDQMIGETGRTRGQTLIVQVPIVNHAGTVSIAPSNVASVKIVETQ